MTRARQDRPRVAIVGMACIYPGAGDLEAFWRNVQGGVDAIADVPPGRWDPEFFDPASDSVDRLYCRRGGFIDEFATFDPLRWGVMPVAVEASEPDQLLALEVAARALADAGYAEREFPRDTTGVILGRGGYIGAGVARFSSKVRNSEELILALRHLLPGISEESLRGVRSEFQSRLGHHGPDTVLGIVPNLTASRVANRLNLRGPAYTIDAACASSLIAVDRGCADLLAGQADLVLAGGIHLVHDVSFWSVFCQMGALSRLQRIRPFDRRADGILIGEGVGLVVLKRLADARADGDRIYAVIRGTGVSSDGRAASPLAPAVEGQRLALERAWRAAGLDPAAAGSVGLIEAHGTATPAGDLAELRTLRDFFGDRAAAGAIGLGSVKSMIGHAMPAAGAAGLIKAALALYHRTLPPTLHCEEPHEALSGSRFRPLRQAEAWPVEGGPRRAGINAFGFGGINAHLLVEEHGPAAGSAVAVGSLPARVLLGAAATPADLARKLRAGGSQPGSGPCRIAVIDPTPARVQQALQTIERGRPFHGRHGIWFTPAGLAHGGGKLAFLFPGFDADFRPRVEDVARFFGRDPLPVTRALAEASSLERTGFGILMVNKLLHDVLGELGLRPDFVCGHSIGEWSAMVAAGVVEEQTVAEFARGLEPGTLSVPGVVFAALGCGQEQAQAALAGLDDVVVSHDNCPHQVIVCGREASVDAALVRLKAQAVLCQKLDFRSGFHTPLFREYLAPVREAVARLELAPPALPLWSATTCRPYPAAAERVRELFFEHLVSPVRFRELLHALYAEGTRLFVQVGTGSLVGFVGDSLKDRPHLAITVNSPKREGLEQLRRTVAALWVEGAAVDPLRLFVLHDPAPAAGRSIRLRLGAPLVRLERPLAERPPAAAPPPAVGADPVLAEFASTLAALERGGREVVEAWRRPPAAAPPPRIDRVTVERRLDLATDRHLLDHCFFPQPANWHNPGDRFPVVPMTMSLQMMASAARRLAGERVVVGLERIRARSWLVAETPIDISIEARRESEDVVAVRIADYIDCRVRLADRYAAAPLLTTEACRNERPMPLAPRGMYEDRWMFHGPSYRGVVELSRLGEREIHGVIETLPAEGALLDCAGQIFGLWIMLAADRDRMAIPVGVDSISFHGPDPEPGRRFDCHVRITQFGERRVRADIDLAAGGRIWCRIRGWEDRRFETNDVMWAMMINPENNTLSEPHPVIPDCHVFREGLARSATRDYFARRYLDAREIEAYRAMNPRRQLEWLPGRIAAKDAVRSFLWKRGAGPLYPIEVEILNEDGGRPLARCAVGGDLRISIAGKRGIAVARVAEGRDVGIDLERVERREPAFEALAFGERELGLLPATDRDEWVARFWAAKEALAKLRGTGLAGNPRRFEVGQRDGGRLVVDGHPVETLADGGFAYAWTSDGEEVSPATVSGAPAAGSGRARMPVGDKRQGA